MMHEIQITNGNSHHTIIVMIIVKVALVNSSNRKRLMMTKAVKVFIVITIKIL